MQATVSPIATILDGAREAWQLREAAAAQQAKQERTEREQQERARRDEQKTAFVERLTALWQDITGEPPAIDEADLVHDGGDHWFWNLPGALQVGVQSHLGGQPPHTHLYLTRNNRVASATNGERFTTLVELGEALAQFERWAVQHQQEQEQAQAAAAVQAAERERQNAWEALRPAPPAPSRILLSGHGGVVLYPSTYAIDLRPFTARDQQPFDTLSLERDEVTRLLAVLEADSGLFVDNACHARATILLALNATFWFVGSDQGEVWRTGPLVTYNEGGTTTSPLRAPLENWLAFRTAHDAWRVEGEAAGFWFD